MILLFIWQYAFYDVELIGVFWYSDNLFLTSLLEKDLVGLKVLERNVFVSNSGKERSDHEVISLRQSVFSIRQSVFSIRPSVSPFLCSPPSFSPPLLLPLPGPGTVRRHLHQKQWNIIWAKIHRGMDFVFSSIVKFKGYLTWPNCINNAWNVNCEDQLSHQPQSYLLSKWTLARFFVKCLMCVQLANQRWNLTTRK